MNWFNIINDLEKVDGDVYDRFSTRRKAMASVAEMGKKVTMASMPLFLASAFQKAYGKSSETVVQVLQYALYLEHLENEFYKLAKAALPNLSGVPALAASAFDTIQRHEQQHVSLLTGVITSLNGTPARLGIDFDIDPTGGKGNGGGPFGVVLTDYSLLLLAAQMFEDTGVRAYKGRAGELIGDPNGALTVALQIHSVEARHASHIRQMRKAAGANVDPWITRNLGDIPAAADPAIKAAAALIYGGEEKSTQGSPTVNIVGTGVDLDQASEAFDETLTPAVVLQIVGDPAAARGSAAAGFLFKP